MTKKEVINKLKELITKNFKYEDEPNYNYVHNLLKKEIGIQNALQIHRTDVMEYIDDILGY